MKINLASNKPYFPEDDRREIANHITEILAGGRLTQGPWVRKLENEFAELCGVRYAVATNSGTSALEILLRYFNVTGGEVVIPTNTFLATGNAVIFAGGKPVLTDICPDTLSMDPQDLERKLSSNTRGVIVVHIAGLIDPRINDIRKLCQKHGLFLLEDAAHAPGAALGNLAAGNLADGAAFSFYPTKPMTTGEGGMITTNDPACYERAQSLRCHGIAIGEENQGENRNLLLRLGHNWRMSEIQAVVGYYQARRLREAITGRNRVADWYYRELSTIEELSLFPVVDNSVHSYYKFPVLLQPGFSRQEVAEKLLKDHGIQSGSIYWPPCHLQPFYRKKFGYRPGDYPVAEDVLARTLALPIYPDMQLEDVLQVGKALKTVLCHTSVSEPKLQRQS